MSQRTERIDELLRQEISTLLTTEAKDPRIGFATVTEVETAPDLRHARVWVSVIGSGAEQTETLEALRHAMHFIRRELGTRLRLKRIPELHVRLDDSLERGTRVLQLIHELEEGTSPDEAVTEPELPTPVRRIARDGDSPDGGPGFPVEPRQKRRRRPVTGGAGGNPRRTQRRATGEGSR